MTREELNDLPYLPQEIKALDDELKRLQHPPRIWDKRKAGRYAAALDKLVMLLQERRERCARQLDRLRAFIDEIQDPILREAFRLRYTKGMTWAQVSIKMGGINTDSCLKQMAHRYFEKVKENGDE